MLPFSRPFMIVLKAVRASSSSSAAVSAPIPALTRQLAEPIFCVSMRSSLARVTRAFEPSKPSALEMLVVARKLAVTAATASIVFLMG